MATQVVDSPQESLGSEGPAEMSWSKKLGNLAGLLLPVFGLLIAIRLAWNREVDIADLAMLAILYFLMGSGITVGYHRLLTHKSFQTYKWLEYIFAVLGAMAFEGPPISWVGHHRMHHAHPDEEGDPHSPWVGRDPGLREKIRGFLWAHMTWLFVNRDQEAEEHAKELVEDRFMRALNNGYVYLGLIVLSMGIPALAGWLIHGGANGALRGFIWAGVVRVFLLYHATFSINSICHMFGRKRFGIKDHSRNVFLLALPTLGEAWHHNHHAFPRSAAHGLRWYEFDISAAVIWLLERAKLVWGVVRISPERQQSMEVRS